MSSTRANKGTWSDSTSQLASGLRSIQAAAVAINTDSTSHSGRDMGPSFFHSARIKPAAVDTSTAGRANKMRVNKNQVMISRTTASGNAKNIHSAKPIKMPRWCK